MNGVPERVFLKACHPASPNHNCTWSVSDGPVDAVEYVCTEIVFATLKRWCKCGPRIHCSFCAIRRELEAATTKQPTEVKEGDDEP